MLFVVKYLIFYIDYDVQCILISIKSFFSTSDSDWGRGDGNIPVPEKPYNANSFGKAVNNIVSKMDMANKELDREIKGLEEKAKVQNLEPLRTPLLDLWKAIGERIAHSEEYISTIHDIFPTIKKSIKEEVTDIASDNTKIVEGTDIASDNTKTIEGTGVASDNTKIVEEINTKLETIDIKTSEPKSPTA